ncbi:AI-2E family transporter [Clostridium sp.]|uniref:AI-2E family transporter n=1 Tax=Clostridium sp. TaxID=1506 RepID=UPI00261B0115|nr:AI-2E family transporter [Clostridium sp.]
MELYLKYKKIINLIINLGIIYFFTMIIKSYFTPFFIIIILFLISNPIFKIISKKVSIKLSALVTISLVNIIFLIVIFFFGKYIINFLNNVYIKNIKEIYYILERGKDFFNLNPEKTIRTINSILNSELLIQGIIITSESIMGYFLSNLITYFLLVDKKDFYKFLEKAISKDFTLITINKIKKLAEVLKLEIYLVFLSASILMIGFRCLQIEKSLFLAVLCAVLDILPFVGTTIVFIPIIIYNIIIKRYLVVIGLILIYILERFTREILEAKFLSSKLELHPIVIIISIYIGVKIFGLIGIVAGPIYSIIAKDTIYNN